MKKTLFLLILVFSVKFLSAQSTVSITPTNVSCNGNCDGSAYATVIGGTAPYTYVWNPGGQTTQSVSGLCAGTYTCSVTDALAGIAMATVNILQPTPVTISFGSISNSSCSGSCNASATAIVTGGTPPYSYLWSQVNFFTPSASNICSGTYTITVTDANGCLSNAPITITAPAPLSTGISPMGTTVCTGNNVAFNSAASGGTPGYNFQWTFTGGSPSSSSIASPVVNYSAPGTYSAILHLTDANNCWVEDTTWITVSDGPTLINTSITEAGCNLSDGSATVNVSGVAPFVYSWLPSGGINATETNLPAGTYVVDVTDPIGCASSFTVIIGDSCNFVWPGDANDDAVADNNDILDIGIANGATGTTRANATLNWIGQPSMPWGQTLLSGTDYKWVDCNGDGTIDLNDTTAVVQNFGFTHNNRSGIPVYNATLPDLAITMYQDSLAANAAGSLSVSLGSVSVPASNVYGLSFTLNFDPAQIDAASFGMNETGTWMGTPGTNLMGVVLHQGTGTGSVEIAITRYNHTNVNGNGAIANLGFMTTNALNASGNTQNVIFSISNVTVISANETTQQVNAVNDSVVVADPSVLNGISVFENASAISAFPNPFDESVELVLPGTANGKSCVITLTDASGRIVLTQQTGNSKSVIIHRGELESGIYFCTVRSDEQMIGKTKLIVK
jgi:hypothetical protein